MPFDYDHLRERRLLFEPAGDAMMADDMIPATYSRMLARAQVLADTLPVAPSYAFTAHVMQAVCIVWNFQRKQVLGKARNPSIFRARAAIVWLVRRLRPDISYPQIALQMRRDHSTIMNSYQRACEMRLQDDGFCQITDMLFEALDHPSIRKEAA